MVFKAGCLAKFYEQYEESYLNMQYPHGKNMKEPAEKKTNRNPKSAATSDFNLIVMILAKLLLVILKYTRGVVLRVKNSLL